MKKYPRYSLGKPINSYVQYKSMVQRCTYKGKLRTDYAGNNLTPEWLNYDNWMDWANNQKGFLNLEANLLFDPEQIKKDGDETVKALKEQLAKLKQTIAIKTNPY